MKEKIKKILPYIINTLIITSILFITLKINNIYPFGNKSIATYDSYYQYQPMLYNLITEIKQGLLTSFSFKNGLGNPFIFNFLYYLSSPLNLIAILFNNPNNMFISVIILKVIITSIVSTFYFKKRANNIIISTTCTIGYIYSAWFTSYYFNIMWLDAFMIFPLFQYGLEELINNKKYRIYFFTLAYIMISNFYMAFLICCYTLIYYLVNIIAKKDKYINKIKNFDLIMVASIGSFLLAFFIIYATYNTFLTMGININNNNNTVTSTIPDILKSFYYGIQSPNLNTNQIIPNISTNIIFIISLIYYFMNSKIGLKEKIISSLAIAFTILCFSSTTADYILNCFHQTISFNYRYSFIFTFYILIIFIRNTKTFSSKIDKKIYLINIILFIFVIFFYKYKSLSFQQLIYTMVFLMAYTILFIFYNNNKLYKYLFLSIVIVESLICSINNIKPQFNIVTNYNSNTTYNLKREIINNNDNPYNSNLYIGTSNLNLFTSMTYTKLFPLSENLGIRNDHKATILFKKNTYIVEMLLNLDSNYYLEKIFSTNENIKDLFLLDNYNLEYQNILIKNMTNVDNIIIKEEPLFKKSDQYNEYIYNFLESNRYTINLQNIEYIAYKDKIYLINSKYFPSKYKYKQIVEEELQNYYNLTLDIEKNETITVKFKEENGNTELDIYSIDKEKLNEVYNYLKKGQIKYTTYTEDTIIGEITVDENQIIYTSIPYDEHWQIEIDGKKVKPIKLLDSLIGIECNEGNHIIKMTYRNNLLIPAIISIFTLAFSIIFSILKIIKNKK